MAGAYLGSCKEAEERLDGHGWRCYLTCCVRLSIEKEPHRYVNLQLPPACMTTMCKESLHSTFAHLVLLALVDSVLCLPLITAKT